MKRTISKEAQMLVALKFADENTEGFKTSLAKAAQVLIDFRDERNKRFNALRTPSVDDFLVHQNERNRIEAALQHITEANGQALAAMHAARTLP